MFSRTALGRPGKLTMSDSWRSPAAARESAARGSTLRDSRSSSSEMPGVWKARNAGCGDETRAQAGGTGAAASSGWAGQWRCHRAIDDGQGCLRCDVAGREAGAPGREHQVALLLSRALRPLEEEALDGTTLVGHRGALHQLKSAALGRAALHKRLDTAHDFGATEVLIDSRSRTVAHSQHAQSNDHRSHLRKREGGGGQGRVAVTAMNGAFEMG